MTNDDLQRIVAVSEACTSTFIAALKTVYTSLSYPELLFDWLITLTLILTLTIFDNIILEKA